MAGQPKKFKSGSQLIELWAEFCEEIRTNQYNEAPTQTSFCKWLSKNFTTADRRTIYNTLNEYFPNIKKDFEAIRADIISEGAMLNKYNSTMSIFALKNWCSWKDKQENDTNEQVLQKLDEVLDQIGGDD